MTGEPLWTTVLLDRDGVINRMRPDYVKCLDELELIPGALDSVAALCNSGRQVLVVTNQSGLGQGLISRDTVDEIHRHLEEEVRSRGGHISAFLVCPHTRDAGCDCRKPAPGLILQAREQMGLDLSRTVLVGDQLTDVQAACAAGCDAILIAADGHAAESALSMGARVVHSLSGAVELICAA